jgi:hypothetical protein
MRWWCDWPSPAESKDPRAPPEAHVSDFVACGPRIATHVAPTGGIGSAAPPQPLAGPPEGGHECAEHPGCALFRPKAGGFAEERLGWFAGSSAPEGESLP